MSVRIVWSDPAPEGGIPSSIEVSWGDDSDPTTDGILQVIGAMAMSRPSAAVKSVARMLAGEPSCARTLCGHPRSAHGDVDDRGVTVPAREGVCLSCRNVDQCRSFVAKVGPS
jgi:hypothetical protein